MGTGTHEYEGVHEKPEASVERPLPERVMAVIIECFADGTVNWQASPGVSAFAMMGLLMAVLEQLKQGLHPCISAATAP